MRRYYVNPRSNAIHIADDLVKPRTDGTTNCGRDVLCLLPHTGRITEEPAYRFCIKCQQLIGEA